MKADNKTYHISVSAPLSPKLSRSEKYFVMKKASLNHSLAKEKHYTSMNIFKNSSVDGLYEFDYKKENPVGGMDTFLSYKNSKRKKNKTIKTNLDALKRSTKKVK